MARLCSQSPPLADYEQHRAGMRIHAKHVVQMHADLADWRCLPAWRMSLVTAVDAAVQHLSNVLNAAAGHAPCNGDWCRVATGGIHGTYKLALVQPNDTRLVIKVPTSPEHAHTLMEEREAMRTLCTLAEDARTIFIPWTSLPFQLYGTTVMLQQRIPHAYDGWFRVRNGASFLRAMWLPPELSPPRTALVASRVAADLIGWERLQQRHAIIVRDLQLVISNGGSVWLLDPAGVDRTQTCQKEGHIHDAAVNASVRAGAPVHGGGRVTLSLLSRPDASDDKCRHAMRDAYTGARQRASLLTYALLASLVAEGALDLAREAMCTHARCELGCLWTGVPPAVRAALRRRKHATAAQAEATVAAMDRLDGLTGGLLDDGGAAGSAARAWANAGEWGAHGGANRCGPCSLNASLTSCFVHGGEEFLAHEMALTCAAANSSTAGCRWSLSACEFDPVCTSLRAIVEDLTHSGGRLDKSDWMHYIYREDVYRELSVE